MSEPYVGEIRLFAGNFAPVGWMFCEGQTLSIADNDVLFNLIGTTYGGDGVSTFNLPDLRGRFPIHQGTLAGGSSYVLGQMAGTETVTLTSNQIPQHNHSALASSSSAGSSDPTNNFWASSPTAKQYLPTGSPSLMVNSSAAGGNQPHENVHPYLCVSFIISLFGIFPTQN